MLVDYKALVASNSPFVVLMEAKKVGLISWLMSNPVNALVQAVYKHEGKRILEYGGDDDSDYITKCKDLWVHAVGYDSGCGSTNEKLYAFTSGAVLLMMEYFVEAEKQRMKSEIEDHKRKIKELTEKIFDLGCKPKGTE